jgi:hypothetical protein
MGRRPRRRIVPLQAGFLLVEFSLSIQLGERPSISKSIAKLIQLE